MKCFVTICNSCSILKMWIWCFSEKSIWFNLSKLCSKCFFFRLKFVMILFRSKSTALVRTLEERPKIINAWSFESEAEFWPDEAPFSTYFLKLRQIKWHFIKEDLGLTHQFSSRVMFAKRSIFLWELFSACTATFFEEGPSPLLRDDIIWLRENYKPFMEIS